jgi:hypothetical protein
VLTDDRPLKEFLDSKIKELKEPIYVWHWYNARGRNPIWTEKISAHDRAGFNHFEHMSSLFFQTFCTNEKTQDPSDCTRTDSLSHGIGNMYGPGLYVATDPVATANYGGGNGWVLLQIRLPKGFRYFDLKHDGFATLPQNVTDVLRPYNCGDFHNSPSLDSLLAIGRYSFGSSYSNYSSQCVLKVRAILKDHVRMDGFSYSYNASTFEQCKQGGWYSHDHAAAFVLTSTRGVTANHVRVFNSQTTDAFSDRVRIQTLFYYVDIKAIGISKFKAIALHDIRMSQANAPANQGLGYNSQTWSPSLLWPDLEGAALDFQVASWLPNYLYQCKDQ